MYFVGEGVPQNYVESAKWYRKAAEQGYAVGYFNLGLAYYMHLGVPEDYTEAAKLFDKAAEQGLAVAQFYLGRMYELGTGVPQDFVQAHKWYTLATARSQGKIERSAQNRDRAEKKMTLAQIAEAQKLAREWKPTPNK